MMRWKIRRRIPAVVVIAAAVAFTAGRAFAGDDPAEEKPPAAEREYLVPELRDEPFRVGDAPRLFLRRLAFSPAYGSFGGNLLYAFRISYHPNSWFGYEAGLGHSPGESAHSLLNTLDLLFRYPLPGRIQPYGSAGYGMIMVFPGRALNANSVTKNAFTYGGGIEAFIRSDVAFRFGVRGALVLGGELDEEGTVAYRYREVTAGLAFYRELK